MVIRLDVLLGPSSTRNPDVTCADCGERVYREVTARSGKQFLAPRTCLCRRREIEAAERIDRARAVSENRRRLEALRRSGLTDAAYQAWTFERDDGNSGEMGEICRRYARCWPEMLKGNHGLLFYGGVGTGKTFLACCIVNALIDRGVPAMITSTPRLIGQLMNYGDPSRGEIVDHLQNVKLLVLDDLGAERGTETALEQLGHVVDTRYRSGLPLVVTTNLSPGDLTHPDSLARKRIFDRVLEVCAPFAVDGTSRRARIGKARAEAVREILGAHP